MTTQINVKNLTEEDIRYINEQRIANDSMFELQEEIETLQLDLINHYQIQGVSIENIVIEDHRGIDISFEKATINHENFLGLTADEKQKVFDKFNCIAELEIHNISRSQPISDEVKNSIIEENRIQAISHINRLNEMQITKRIIDAEMFNFMQTLIEKYNFTFDISLSHYNDPLQCDYDFFGTNLIVDETFMYLKILLEFGAEKKYRQLLDYKLLVVLNQKEDSLITTNRFIIESLFHVFIRETLVDPMRANAKIVVEEMKAEVKDRYKKMKSYFYSKDYLMMLLCDEEKQAELLEYLN